MSKLDDIINNVVDPHDVKVSVIKDEIKDLIQELVDESFDADDKNAMIFWQKVNKL